MKISMRNFSGVFLIILLLLPIVSSNFALMNNEKTPKQIESTNQGRKSHHNVNRLVPIDEELLKNQLEKEISPPETFKVAGITWNNPPGSWWDTDWEYRVNVTITEPNVVSRTDWPIDVYIQFNPPAFKYSIRVIRVDPTGYVEVPSQVWDITYYNDTHLSAAKVTFLVTIPKGGTKEYQIYWSIDYVDPPVYSKRISIDIVPTPEGDMYVIRSETKGWQIKLPPKNGGKASNMTLPTGYEIGHDWLHFGTTRAPSLAYGGYWGTGNTNNMRYASRYILEETDPLLEHYEGVIFVTYCVEDIPLYDENLQDDVAQVTIKYRIFDWGIIAEEKVEWLIDDYDVDYYIAGWVFDQDDGASSSTFNAIANDTAIIFNKTYPIVTYTGDVSGSNYDRSFINALGIPLLSVYFVYLSAGSHSVYLDYLVYDYDDSYIYVFDTGGNLIYQNYDYNNYVTYTFSVSADGWYYIVIGCYGDDNGDGYLEYNIAIDGQSVASNVRVGDFDRSDGYTVASDSIKLYYLNVTMDQINIPHNTTLEWGDDSNLDLILYGPPTCNPDTGHMIAYSTQTTGRTEYIEWTPDAADYYPIIVYRRTAEASTSSFTVKDVILTGFEFFDYYNFKSLDHVALFNNETLNGIGYVILHEEVMAGSITYTDSGLMWYNEGNDSEKDYVIVTKWFKGVTVTATSVFYMNYSVFPWTPQGNTLSQMYTVFAGIKNSLKNPLTYSLAAKEKFLIRVTINVTDDDLKPIQGATVELINVTSGSVAYSGTTNSSGVVIFEVIRYQYNFKVSLTSGGRTYINDTITQDYSAYAYTVHSDSVAIKFKDLIRFRLKAFTDTSPPQIIQDGRVVLSDPSDPSTRSEAYTNLTGWIDIYIPKGTWELAFNASKQTPEERWDNITVYSDETLTTVVAGYGINVTLTLTTGVKYYLVDHDITEAPVPTKLVTYNTLMFYEVYWMETITIYVNLTRDDTGENIAGTVYWYVFNSSGDVVLSGTATEKATGSFEFSVDTTNLDAGAGYTIHINATPDSPLSDGKTPLKPSPVNIGLSVKERPMSPSITFNPGNIIYWNESLEISVHLADSLSGDDITGAIVKVFIYTRVGTIEAQLTDQGNGYYSKTLKSELTSVDVGSYTLIVKAEKMNYETTETSFTLTIEERPTIIIYDSYIETPWTSSYTISVQYIDERYDEIVKNAEASYILKNASTGTEIYSGDMACSEGYYKTTLSLASIVEGTYLIEIFIGKKNFENKTVIITFVVRLHTTTAQPDTTKLVVYYDENIKLKLTYYDEDLGKYISGARTSCTIAGIEEGMPTLITQLTDLGNGTYVLDMPASDLGTIGSYSITITISKRHYRAKTIYVSLLVNPIPTIATTSKTVEEVEWGLATTIRIWYNDSRTKTPIPSPSNASFIIQNETWSQQYQLTPNQDGSWSLIINTTEMGLAPSVYTIYVYLEKPYHENKTIFITLTVTEIRTYAYAQPANITLYWGETDTIAAYYIRTRDEAFIVTDPEFNITDITNGTLVRVGVTITIEEGYYEVLIDASKLTEEHTYVVIILFKKTYYEEASVTIYIKILPIPVTVSVVPLVADITWGDEYNFTITVLNALNLSGVEDISIRMIVYVGGEEVTPDEGITLIEIGDGVYVIIIKSGLLNTTAYNIYLTLSKPHYALPTVNVTARINPVYTTVGIRTTKTVQKNPATGAAVTKVEVALRESETGAPISGATVWVMVMRGETVVKELLAEELEDEPGVYVAYIDWSDVEPGDYTIHVRVEEVQRKGYSAPAETVMSVAAGATEAGVRVDYLGGSTVIAGKRYPNLLIYPIIIAVFVAVGFAGYRYYSWIRLPIEVREVITLMKKVKKGVYEYPAPTREEAFKELLAEQLGLG